jgi:Ser/Thr protein kinase RdoA (MazF antagonist)
VTLGELDWLIHLDRRGVPVSAPIRSERGDLVERIGDGDGGYFVVSAFRRAAGEVLADRPALRKLHWSPTLFREWGRVVARLHLHAVDYRPPARRRSQWFEYDVVDAARFVDAEETVVIGRARALVEKLRALPTEEEGYGLIHADLTENNFCFQDGRLTVFDFDNCEYAWFVKDVAVILYYVVAQVPPNERAAVGGDFLSELLTGYREVRPLTGDWLAIVPDLLALQRIMNYALFHQYRDRRQLRDEDRAHWRETREAIERDAPILMLDFRSFA